MLQKPITLADHISALRNEALMLLRYYIAFKRIVKFENFDNITRTEFVDQLVALKAIENDMVVRISKLDDRRKDVHSLPRALLALPSTHPHKLLIKNKITAFSTLIRGIKTHRRHDQLAHLKLGEVDNELKLQYDLGPAIRLIIEIIDLINEKLIPYQWSDGRYEKYDLRKDVMENTDKLRGPTGDFF